MDEIEIRQYRPSDLQSCRALWVTLTQHHGKIYDDPSMFGDDSGAEFDQHLARVGPDRIWVAELEGQVLGLVGLVVQEQEAEVEPIVVLPHERGRGIGRALLARAVEEARRAEVPLVSAKPVARNTDALSFFHMSGFRTVGHIQLFVELGQTPLCAWKPGLELFGETFDY